MLNTDIYLASTKDVVQNKVLFTLRNIEENRSVRSVRVSSTLSQLFSISGTTTRETPGMDTDRKVVRYDIRKTDAATGKTATASAYLVIVAPQAITTDEDVQTAVNGLIEFMLDGASPSTLTTHAMTATNSTKVASAVSALLSGSI